MSVVRARAKASFQKKPGYLVLTQRSLSWTEDKQKEPRLNLPNTSLQKMFFSKPGSASTSMKVMDGPDPKINAYTFVFTSLKAVAEGNNFKELITNILTANIAQQQAAAREQAPATDTQAAAPVTITPRADRPLSVNDLRKFVLLKRADLAALHRELVMTGNLTETEFWAGREHLLSAEESIERQRKGRPTQMLELRGAGTNEKGDIKITITPERAQQIFIEFPVVKRAYDENVPDPLSPVEFWTRYLSSKLFDRNQASSRSAAAQHTIKDDPIFDKYLQKEDDGDEPLHQRAPPSTLLIDLNATHEDHGETGNSKDFTMKAGGLRSTLPLIRKFNEHSTNVLDAGLQPSKRQRIGNMDELYYSQLDMEDLRGPQYDAGIELGLQASSRILDSDSLENESENGKRSEPVDPRALVGTLRSWHNNLSKFAPGKKQVEDAFTSLSQNVTERVNVKSRKNNLPDDLLQAMGNLQAATAEFLRQFWSALYDDKDFAKDHVEKMASYLGSTYGKIAPMMTAARNQGHDPQVVRDAFTPTLDAVNKALAIYKARASV
ncbi:RNA polymerase II transcription factor B subunit 1 [Rhizoctonia solani]|uniref:RNA polymerase II transcription factor B subunit 1 n=1 Tax=Rhizoctonia solani TaxID=456999 RepID=A0A8H7LIF5_9AGAM|nr:RNA polymerase II transcription factor B subunit 1 [Rhizoctonia solani]KAF8678242.1 TFIIH p62 subunit, N-terminal domain [Rhizoctonia solani]QRW21445.1 RNA polymerase II transcription factor B subunit 1 [Rhizoctonia solani]